MTRRIIANTPQPFTVSGSTSPPSGFCIFMAISKSDHSQTTGRTAADASLIFIVISSTKSPISPAGIFTRNFRHEVSKLVNLNLPIIEDYIIKRDYD